MIDTPRILPEILKFRFSLHVVKDDWPPLPHRILPDILKVRFSLCMVKDDWLTPQNSNTNFSLDLVCTWTEIIDPQNFTRNFKV